jgi:hypothetical protein
MARSTSGSEPASRPSSPPARRSARAAIARFSRMSPGISAMTTSIARNTSVPSIGAAIGRPLGTGASRASGEAMRQLLPQPGGFERCYRRLRSRSRARARSRSPRSSLCRRDVTSPTKVLRACRSARSCASKLRMRAFVPNMGRRALLSLGRVGEVLDPASGDRASHSPRAKSRVGSVAIPGSR